MNIIVFPHKIQEFFFKPDSSLVRGSEDYFPPDIVKEMSVALSVVVKIAKSAKCISGGFAARYYNEYGLGITIYPDNLINSALNTIFSSGKALSSDNTAYVTEKFFSIDNIRNGGCLVFMINEKVIFNSSFGSELKADIDKSLEDATQYITLKRGDLLFLELTEREPVNIGDNLKLSYSRQNYLDFCIR
ncbi:MAG: hypothetical protein ABFC28_09130 [Rikenellaceae bacterium]